jgi:hypothetical protein
MSVVAIMGETSALFAGNISPHLGEANGTFSRQILPMGNSLNGLRIECVLCYDHANVK